MDMDKKVDEQEQRKQQRNNTLGAARPSQARRTTGQVGPCDSCGATEWIQDCY